MTRRSPWAFAVALAAVLLIGIVPAAGAATRSHHHAPPKKASKKNASKKKAPLETADTVSGWWPSRDVQSLHYSFGPIAVSPGQNNIKTGNLPGRPTVPGWVTSFKPNLVYAKNGVCPAVVKEADVPPVDIIHLHHGVWVVNGKLTFAAGEEKSRLYVPKGFGYPYAPTDSWALSYMVHNLTPQPTAVCMTYDIGFIPTTSKFAAGIVPVRTQWMDVVGGVYPVFDVHRGSGTNGTFTYPNQANLPPAARRRAVNQWRVPNDQTIVAMVGHLHPGGLYNSLYDTRIVDGVARTVLVFRSGAHYFEPAGSVSWDVAMVGTPPTWKALVKAGDILTLNTTYDSSKASWYEAMGIMPLTITNTPAGGVDPFVRNTAVPGVLNHGHLAENDHHGGEAPAVGPPASSLPDGPLTDGLTVPIDNFVYGQGDLTLGGSRGRPPVVHQGQSLTFVNNDYNVGPGEWHTITSCKAPCNAQTGIAYPLANGPVDFDSGELGLGPAPTANRTTWSTPSTLPAGTYSYFCRIHPFMRGSFRVLPAV
jgi:plastocyanin